MTTAGRGSAQPPSWAGDVNRPSGPGRPSGTGTGLQVQGLGVALPGGGSTTRTVLHQVDLEVRRGEVVVLLGPSGAGKSTLIGAILGLLPVGSLVRGHAWWEDEGIQIGNGSRGRVDLLDPAGVDRDRLRGRVAAWLPQSPVSSMTPVLSVGHHLLEKSRVHVPAAEVPALVDAALDRHDVERAWWRRLPSQLSGGQAQRVSNALALLGDPGLVLADEPTTGLDRTRATRTGAELRVLADEQGRAVLVVTHDLVLAEQIADAVVELDSGRTGERMRAEEVAARARAADHRRAPHRAPAHLAVGPSGDPVGLSSRPAAGERPALVGTGLTLARGRGMVVRRGVHVRVEQDRTTGLMAPSGAGKTTLLRTLALLHAPAAGRVELEGLPLRGTGHRVPAEVRRRIGYVPQDPHQAVDPRWSLARILLEPLRLGSRPAGEEQAAGLLDRVGLPPDLAQRRPDQVSGGQLQRVVLARALALEPDYLLLDEPTSMVDSATAEAVARAVHEHQHATGCGVLVASHDEELIRTWCDTVITWE